MHSASLLYTVYNTSPVATLLCPGLIGKSPGCLSLFRYLSMSFLHSMVLSLSIICAKCAKRRLSAYTMLPHTHTPSSLALGLLLLIRDER